MAGQKLSAGDVRRLYERHAPALLAYARSFTPDAAAAEDVVHEVFVKLLRGETDVPDIPLAYLYRAVRNGALNARRKRSSVLRSDVEMPWFQHNGGNQEEVLTLQAALSDLPEEQREAVIMRIWSGMTIEEVAAATHVPLHTAASRYRYALEKLRERLRPRQRDK